MEDVRKTEIETDYRVEKDSIGAKDIMEYSPCVPPKTFTLPD